VTIVNKSLIPSGIVGVGFDFCGQIYWFREPEIRDERTSLQFRQRQASAGLLEGAPVPFGHKRLDWPLQVEGFLGAFVRAKEKRDAYPTEIIALSKEVKDLLKKMIKDYPDEVLNGVSQAAYAVDKARNRFSESHFANEAGSWLATYVRDLVNTQIRLLLHFM